MLQITYLFNQKSKNALLNSHLKDVPVDCVVLHMRKKKGKKIEDCATPSCNINIIIIIEKKKKMGKAKTNNT